MKGSNTCGQTSEMQKKPHHHSQRVPCLPDSTMTKGILGTNASDGAWNGGLQRLSGRFDTPKPLPPFARPPSAASLPSKHGDAAKCTQGTSPTLCPLRNNQNLKILNENLLKTCGQFRSQLIGTQTLNNFYKKNPKILYPKP